MLLLRDLLDLLFEIAALPADAVQLALHLRDPAERFLRLVTHLLRADVVDDLIDVLMAAVGVRNASRERLFLEDYLSVPVEAVMPEPGAERSRIAEIAHLAGVEAGVSRYLFASLSVWLDGNDYDWVVCTGTDQLRNSFHRLGIATHVLAAADPAKLPDNGAGWGRYYDHHPVVMAIRVADGISALRAAGLLNRVQWVTPEGGERIPDVGGAYGRLA
ncbi:MAG: thermostable hemolysin [Marinobacter sp.]